MQFKLLNANLWLLPLFSSKHNRKRIKKFIELVNKLDPDIITLQEVWLKKYIRYLKRNLPNYKFYYKESILYNKSGLLTLSKFNFKFQHNFYNSVGVNIIEKVAQKGYQVLSSKDFKLINTHLYTDFFKKSDKHSINQFNQLKQPNIILVGDLNLNIKRFEQLNKGFFKVSNKEITCTTKNKYQCVSYNRLSNANAKLDYVATSNKKIKIKTKVIKKPIVSDHYILFSKISF